MLLEKPGVDVYYKKQSLNLIKACIGCVLPPLQCRPNDLMVVIPSLSEDLEVAEKSLLAVVRSGLSAAKAAAHGAIYKKILAAVFLLSSQAEFEQEMLPYLEGVCRCDGLILICHTFSIACTTYLHV
jgi:hypothetical protein